jgi:uncharacterized membrane protein YedE/YeeE
VLTDLLDTYGDPLVLFLAGGLVGLLFGALAQHSRFCLRAATVELGGGVMGSRMAIWLLAFSAAVIGTQGAVLAGLLDASGARQIAGVGSLSGAIIGGGLFGVGMILARGCASRLLVLSATGNLRALVAGLVLTLAAQASLRGGLSPLREWLFGLWTIPGGYARDLLALTGIGHWGGFVLGLAILAYAVVLTRKTALPLTEAVAAFGVGLAVALGWALTYAVAQSSFEVVAVSSVTFSGPSTDTLMGLVNERALPLDFNVGLIPGVFLGAGLMALARREVKIQRFGPDTPMERYLAGAILMGFGSMLAGGCAVGAGMSGGAVFSLTAWLALFSMWVGAVVTNAVLTGTRPFLPVAP